MSTDPRRLSFLLAVHRAGGVLAAGEMLGITPSAVSQQIARLEAEEGCSVLDRTPRGVSLTPEGRVLVDAAERIEAELVQARQAIAALGDGVTGLVRIGSFQTAIRWLLGPILPLIATNYPGLVVDIRDGDPAECAALLRTGELDIVMAERDTDVGSIVPRGTSEVPLLEEPWQVVIAAGQPQPQRPSDLAGYTFISGPEGSASELAIKRMERSLGAKINTLHTTHDFASALALVAARQGAALIPALALHGNVQQDKIQVVSLAGLGTRRLFLRHRVNRREPSPGVQVVTNLLVKQAREIKFN
ncbi:MAG: LysR family transcriptional regulator [Cellulomonadaceae bacterium]|nr:LysR family transcriptional regulator [Cellulomonadaceae bacterium]